VSTPRLRTNRLLLRPLVALDAEALRAAIDDFEVVKWTSVIPFPYTLDDALWFIGQVADGQQNAWVIDEGGFAGIIGMGDELGYWLTQDRWGKGYATEAGQAVLRWHFRVGPGGDVTSGHFIENVRSAHVLEKLGFQEAGLRMIPCRARGHDMESRRMILTRDRWLAHHA
jgi:RimJ/RimL family protein N-acetyltransferase